MASRGDKLEDYGEAPSSASRAPASEPALDTYEENDNVVTSFLEPPPAEPKWLVQVTPLDRRSMSNARLRTELRNGRLVHGDTLVWRGGMQTWLPVLDIAELSRELAADEMPASSARARLASTLPPRAASGFLAARLSSMPPLRLSSMPPLRLSSTPPARLPSGTSSSAGSLVATAAASALVAALTLALLGWCGAFEAGDNQHPNRVPSLTPPGGTPLPE